MSTSLSPSFPEQIDPPPYTPPRSGMANNYGFPTGYFIIKSLATSKLLDVASDKVHDGSEIILWPEKETSLVEGFRKPEADNQVFFIDDTGALCSRLSGHAIDVEDGGLFQRHRRPMSYPYPNPHSHPLPRFWYSNATKQILVRFQCDPAYPIIAPDSAASSAWRKQPYVLTSVPKRKPRSIFEDAADAFNAVVANPLSPFTSMFSGVGSSETGASTIEEVRESDIDLREEELMEEDRGAEEEDDDSPDLERKVRVVMTREAEIITDATKLRRTWEVIPLRWTRATNASQTSPSRSRST